MNVNEYGVLFAAFAAYDMSAYTSASIQFTKPDGVVLTKPASVPAVPLVTPGGTFPASQYATCIFAEGDVDQVGQWSARILYFNSVIPQELISAPGTFCVNP